MHLRANPPGDEASRQGAELEIVESVRVACNLPSEGLEAPRFEFEEAELTRRGQLILSKLAACLHDGALANDTVIIVGEAGARGVDEDGERQGMRRAESARDYLLSRGVPAQRLRLEVNRETNALGSADGQWPFDRHVEIRRVRRR